MPTPNQIASAARLVPEHTSISSHGHTVEWTDETGENYRPWQPWADTEAGQADAFKLLAAVMVRFHVMDGPTFHRLAPYQGDVNEALRSGNVQQIQQATFAAAVAIGEYEGDTNDR